MLHIPKDRLVYQMDKDNPPVATASSGDTLRFVTCDCFTDTIHTEKDLVTEIDFSRINPATGPVYIEGAQAGDVLAVTIQRILPGPQGVMVAAPEFGLLGDKVTETETGVFPIEKDTLNLFGATLPLTKMIGVIGTAPAGEPVETGTPGAHGGNMDCTLIKEGATLYLPVEVPGALLALGDLHAAMGDGEISVSGVEMAGEVEVVVELIKNTTLPTPAVQTEDTFAVLYSDDTMEKASYHASERMVRYLQDTAGLSFNEAYMLLSAAGRLSVCQIVDPQVTMRMELPISVLEAVRKKNL